MPKICRNRVLNQSLFCSLLIKQEENISKLSNRVPFFLSNLDVENEDQGLFQSSRLLASLPDSESCIMHEAPTPFKFTDLEESLSVDCCFE